MRVIEKWEKYLCHYWGSNSRYNSIAASIYAHVSPSRSCCTIFQYLSKKIFGFKNLNNWMNVSWPCLLPELYFVFTVYQCLAPQRIVLLTSLFSYLVHEALIMHLWTVLQNRKYSFRPKHLSKFSEIFFLLYCFPQLRHCSEIVIQLVFSYCVNIQVFHMFNCTFVCHVLRCACMHRLYLYVTCGYMYILSVCICVTVYGSSVFRCMCLCQLYTHVICVCGVFRWTCHMCV